MATNLPLQSGGQLVVARAHRVEMAFSVAGESYLEVLDSDTRMFSAELGVTRPSSASSCPSCRFIERSEAAGSHDDLVPGGQTRSQSDAG